MTSQRLYSAINLLALAGAAILAAEACEPPGKNAGLGDGGGGVTGNGGAGPGGIDGAAQGGSDGSACGDPGTQCCAGNQCSGGGCCVSGICMMPGGSCVGLGGGICSAGACGDCGGPGLPCCGPSPGSGTCTAPGTRCSAGTCTTCGELGSACCTDATGGGGTCSGAGVICSNSFCVRCGSPGAACCPGGLCAGPGCCYDNICVGESAPCGAGGGTCQAGRCSGCGSAGQACCSLSCYDGLTCKGGTCASCGNLGEACCPGAADRCKPGTACSSATGDGVCARCGSLGDACCANNTCTDGCCSSGKCIANSGGCLPGSPDAGIEVDAPIAGTDGGIGTGGTSGTGGTIGTGGSVSNDGMVNSGGMVGSGGMGGSGGIGSGGNSGGAGAGGCGDLIDDMESGTGYICEGSGRAGHWYTYIDSGASSTISPATGIVAVPEQMATPRGTSNHAMHASGTYSTYTGLACLLNNAVVGTPPGTFNATGYTGFRFYAKGTGSLVIVSDMPSTIPTANQGTCALASCYGNYYTYGPLTSTWTQITVPFSSLKNGVVTPFQPATIWSIGFQFYTTSSTAPISFDLWIDDLTLYK